LAFAFSIVATAGCRGEEVTQPFPFNHSIHIKADVECLQCHEGILDPEEWKVPQIDTCMGCHKAMDPGNNPLLQRLAKVAESGKGFDWDPTLRLEDHVFFPHLRHVDIAEIECTECHSDMPKRTKPPSRRRTWKMNDCIACHEKNSDRPAAKRVTTDCGSCHH